MIVRQFIQGALFGRELLVLLTVRNREQEQAEHGGDPTILQPPCDSNYGCSRLHATPWVVTQRRWIIIECRLDASLGTPHEARIEWR
jgi:hypothetical protein